VIFTLLFEVMFLNAIMPSGVGFLEWDELSLRFLLWSILIKIRVD